MTLDSLPRNTVRGRGGPASPRTGRHARPASPPATALADVLRDRSLERIRSAERAIADAHARLRGAGADSDAVSGAFAVVRDSLSEAGDTVREARRDLALVVAEWEQFTRVPDPARYPEAAAPVVPDPPGEDRCPDPAGARTPAQFMDTLRRYRQWAGEPAFRAMEHIISKQGGPRFAASTICAALKGDVLPSLPKVQAVIAACGGSDPHQQAFTAAWRRLALPPQHGTPPCPRALYPVSESA